MEEGYSICFNEWALDKSIKNELGLLLIISSLTAEKGYCFASNKYLSGLFGEPEKTISRKIKVLEEKGYIEIEYEKRGCEIVSRKIRLPKMRNVDTQNCGSYGPQNCGPTVRKNEEDNIISINNTSNNITSINNKEKYKRESRASKPTLEEVQDYINDKQLDVNAQSFYDYFEATNWVDSKGNKVKSWKGKLLTWNSYGKNKDSPKKKRATFADLLEKENENDKEGNNADTRYNADSVFEILSDYTVE